MAWKYIVVRVGNRMEVPIIFPQHMVHSEVAAMVKGYYALEGQRSSGGLLSAQALNGLFDAVVPVSAGETLISVASCFGGSETLQLKARPTDRTLLHSYAYTGGILDEEDEVGPK